MHEKSQQMGVVDVSGMKNSDSNELLTRSLQVPQFKRKFSLAVGLIDPSSFSLNDKLAQRANVRSSLNSNANTTASNNLNLNTPLLPINELSSNPISRPLCFDSRHDSRVVNEAYQVIKHE